MANLFASAGFTDGLNIDRLKDVLESLRTAQWDLQRVRASELKPLITKLGRCGFTEGTFMERLDGALGELERLRSEHNKWLLGGDEDG